MLYQLVVFPHIIFVIGFLLAHGVSVIVAFSLKTERDPQKIRFMLELFDERQAEVIDQFEAEKRVSGQIRFALQAPDLQSALKRLLANGATLVHAPVMTPWGDYNVRLQDPDGMQITLFQVNENSR